jgi:hypothetical protein
VLEPDGFERNTARRGYTMDGKLTQNAEAVAETEVLHNQLATAQPEDAREIGTVAEHGETWRLLMGLARPEVAEITARSKRT